MPGEREAKFFQVRVVNQGGQIEDCIAERLKGKQPAVIAAALYAGRTSVRGGDVVARATVETAKGVRVPDLTTDGVRLGKEGEWTIKPPVGGVVYVLIDPAGPKGEDTPQAA